MLFAGGAPRGEEKINGRTGASRDAFSNIVFLGVRGESEVKYCVRWIVTEDEFRKSRRHGWSKLCGSASQGLSVL